MMETESSSADSSNGCCYLCNQCASSFHSLPELEAHLSTHSEESGAALPSSNSAENSPSSSDGSFPYEENQSIDQSMVDQDQDIVADSPTAALVVDPEVTSSPSSLGSTPNGASGKLYPCRFCAKLFVSRSLLNIHYTHTHRDKPQYECEDCGKIFSVKRELATHRRIHSGEQTHACAQCGKEFGTRQLLKKHWMWHTGQRSHVCPHCGKAFFQKGHLTQHLMIHAGGRPHVCQLCNKTFIFKFDLNRHMKIHAERGFACSKCGKAFLKQSTLIEHQNCCSGQDATKNEDPDSKETGSVGVKPERPSKSPRGSVASVSSRSATPTQPAPQSQFFTPPQRLVCLLCMQEFPSQTAYSIHFSVAHFREAAMHLQQQQQKVAAAAGLQNAGVNGTAVTSGIFGNNPLFYPPTGAMGTESSSPTTDATTALTTNWPGSFNDNQNSSEGNNSLVSPRSVSSADEAQNSGKLSTNGDSDISNATTTISEENQKGISTNTTTSKGADGSNTSSSDTMLVQISDNQSNGHFPILSNIDSCEQSGASKNLSNSEHTELKLDENQENHSTNGCSECQSLGIRMRVALSRMNELERNLAVKDVEISRLKEKMRRVGAVAGSLLESCSEFDKLWMLHSKKVYSQIQSVLNSLE